jgi:SAM-dependent methyltransferase
MTTPPKTPEPAATNPEFGGDYAQWQMARKTNVMRRLVKARYINNLLRFVQGPTVDVGCGAGQILERLPPGSLGIEVNPVLVRELNQRGMTVKQAQADPARLDISAAAGGSYQSLVLSHVLEHFDDAAEVLRKLLADARQLGIGNVIIVVPGQVGYGSDVTHKTFVTWDYLQQHGVLACQGYALTHHSYFPGNVAWLGKVFIYHEMMLVYRPSPGA